MIFTNTYKDDSIEFINICKKHSNCNGCPFLSGGVQFSNGITFCEISMMKGKDKNEKNN